MRWLIALGLVVAACSGSSGDEQSAIQGQGSEAGETGSDVTPQAGEGATSEAGAGGTENAPGAAGAMATAGGELGLGAGGAGGESMAGAGGEIVGNAGQGGESNSTTGGAAGSQAAGTGGLAGGGSGGSIAGSGGMGGQPEPVDPCKGVAPWDPTELYTDLTKGDKRTLRGGLWECLQPSSCTTYPGHESAPGWKRRADCADPKEGGEPQAQCLSGACCEGGFFRPPSYVCGEKVESATCRLDPAPSCGSATTHISREYHNLFCTGESGTDCGRVGPLVKESFVACPDGFGCGGSPAACKPCSG